MCGHTKCTQKQMDALFMVYLRWQNKTPHAIMPESFEIIDEDDYRKGDYIGEWVGGPVPIDREPSGAMFLGIEWDGYTHS